MTKIKILIIDDTPMVHVTFESSAAYLEDFEAEVIKAYNHAEGIQKLKDNLDIDICFVDHHFGTNSLSGVELAKRLKKIKPDALLVLHTAYFADDKRLAEAVRSNCFIGYIDRGQMGIILNTFLNENAALKLRLQEREAKKQAKTEKQRADAYASTVKKFSPKQLLSTLVRMYCIEKVIAAKQNHADEYGKLDEFDNIKMPTLAAGNEWFEKKFDFTLANIGGRSSKEMEEFIKSDKLNQIKNIILEKEDWTAISSASYDIPLGNRKVNSFFNDKELQVIQILKENPQDFTEICKHYEPIKLIKEKFKV